jgi:hypothetical protein
MNSYLGKKSALQREMLPDSGLSAASVVKKGVKEK